MTTLTATPLMTADELEKMPKEKGRFELAKGELIKMPPAGYVDGEIAANILLLIGNYIKKHGLGKVFAAETGFFLSQDPDTVRAPDVAFVTPEHARQQERRQGFFVGPPDLAVEVVSPSESVEEVQAKLLDYLLAGTQMVWIVYPLTRTITVYHSLDQSQVLTQNDTLEGGAVLPGFSIPVAEIFE